MKKTLIIFLLLLFSSWTAHAILIAIGPPPPSATGIEETDLEAWWKFENNWVESITENEDLTWTTYGPPTFESAAPIADDYSAEFSGSAQYAYILDADLPAGFPLNGVADYSICAKFDYDDWGSNSYLVTKYYSNVDKRGVAIRINSSHYVEVLHGTTGGGSYEDENHASALNAAGPNMAMCYTEDGDTGAWTIDVYDLTAGSVVGSQASGTWDNTFNDEDAALYISGRQPSGTDPWTGLIDDLKFYSKVLTADEITAYFTDGWGGGGGYVPPPATGISARADVKGLWFFEEDAIDEKSEYTFTPTNSPTYTGASPLQGSYSLDLESGSSQYLTIADGSLDQSFPFASGYTGTAATIAFRIEIESLPASLSYILSKYNTDGARTFGIALTSEGILRIYNGYNYGDNYEQTGDGVHDGPATALSTGVEYAVVYTLNRSTRAYTIDVYNMDTEILHTSKISDSWSNITSMDTAPLMIGDRYDGELYYDGKIDEVVFANTKWTADEINSYLTDDWSGSSEPPDPPTPPDPPSVDFTYYARADGLASLAASEKDAGGGCGSRYTAMSVSTHNSSSFLPGTRIVFCPEGGNITQKITPPSSGSTSAQIIYDGWENGACDPTASTCSNSAYISTSGEQMFINKNYITVEDFRFSSCGTSRSIIIGTYGGKAISGIKILNNDFADSTYPGVILLTFTLHDSVIDNNDLGTTGSGQRMVFNAGRRNIISNNRITDGRTLILVKRGYEATALNYESHWIENVIYNNTGGSHSEEGISFDGNPTLDELTPIIDYDTVSSVSSNVVTLSSGNWGGGDDTDMTGLYMVVVVGSTTELTQWRKITDQSGADFTLESSITGLGAGDTVAILSAYIDNVIAYNSISGGYSTDRILLYGGCYNNLIAYNDLNGGDIQFKSLDRELVSLFGVTGNANRGPVGYNLVRENYDVRTIKFRLRCHDVAGSYSPYMSYGNTAEDNVVSDEIFMNYQYYSIDGNTGGYDLVESNATESCGTATPYASDIGASPVTTFGSYGACSDGEITDWCSCGDVDYPVGYCYSGVFYPLPQ